MSARAPEKSPPAGLKPPSESIGLGCSCGRTCGENGGVKTNGEECDSRIHERDCRCFSHTTTRSDAERHEAWRRGGLAATAPPDAADVPVERHQSRSEVARARDEVFALVKARAISAPVGQTLLASLRDADAQRDRAEVLAMDRKGRRPQEHRLVVRLEPWARMLASQHRATPPPALKRAPEAPR